MNEFYWCPPALQHHFPAPQPPSWCHSVRQLHHSFSFQSKVPSVRAPQPHAPGRGTQLFTTTTFSRKGREKREQERIKSFALFFTRMSDVPRCPNPRPGCVYPRTSLLFCANQTRAGYTLTPSRDKAAQGTGSSPPVTSSAAKPRSSQPEHGEFLPAARLGSGCSTTPALLSSAALHRVPAGGRARRAAAGTRHHPEPSLPGLDTGFTGDSLIRHPVLQHSCSLTSGGPDQNALLAVIKPCTGCWRWVLPHALPRSRFLLFRGLGHWVPQLGAGPDSFTALSIQIVAGTE